MTRFETTVAIARARDAVFAYVADPRHFPAWNSAVESAVPLNETNRAMQAMTSAGLGVRSLPIMIQRLSSVGSSPRVSRTAVSAGLHRGCTTPDIGPVATNSPGC